MLKWAIPAGTGDRGTRRAVLASEKYWPVHSLSCSCHCWYLGCNQPHEHHCFAWQTFFNLSLGVMLEGGCSQFIGPVCETPYRSSLRWNTYFDILLVRKLLLTYQIIINIHWIKQDFFILLAKLTNWLLDQLMLISLGLSVFEYPAEVGQWFGILVEAYS